MSGGDSPDSEIPQAKLRRWRERASRTGTPDEDAALEQRLRAEFHSLANSGLTPDEAWLVALRRLGAEDAATRAHVLGAPDLLWAANPAPEARRASIREIAAALAFAAGAAGAIKLPQLLGVAFSTHEEFYARNTALLILPFVAALLLWRRGFAVGHAVKAASVAGLLVTTGAMIAEKPKKEAAPAMPAGGMDY